MLDGILNSTRRKGFGSDGVCGAEIASRSSLDDERLLCADRDPPKLQFQHPSSRSRDP